jgi:DNA mismatch repair protein MutL
MSSIRILPDIVANQIAAGEVIERPVAVVKELIENSVDAGATRIEVEFRNGGKSYIRIEDNGKGMSPDEALLSLERHATSKIREAVDLSEISSFGFRGEALPSIASVSRFTLRTRTEGWEHGTEISVNGGKLLNKKECGMPVGTVIEVAQLFNSVPARRKFLKTDSTETAHITYQCRLFAVANPKVAFRVLENGRTVFQSPACEHLEDRIAEIWGRALANDLIPVSVQDESKQLRLTGLTAKPGVGRSTRRELVTLVNRRPVDSRTLGFAVLDAYHGRIQKGRYPPAFLMLDIQPHEVDVNVHPAKREVRFRNDGDIRRFVLGAISETLARYQEPTVEAPTVDNASKPQPSSQPSSQLSPQPSPQPVARENATPAIHLPAFQNSPGKAPSHSKAAPGPVAPSALETEPEHEPPKPNAPETPRSRSDWKLITLLHKRYALFDSPKGLVMLHLRHADQRIRFEQIKKSFAKAEPPSQNLLIPEPIELEPLAAEALKQHLNLLNDQGFAIEEFGRNFYRIEAVPTWLDASEAESFIRDTIDLIRQRGSSVRREQLLWDALARLAAEGSYQQNDRIDPAAAQRLAEDLMQCEVPHTSPSGKPTYSEITWSEWDRRFGQN